MHVIPCVTRRLLILLSVCLFWEWKCSNHTAAQEHWITLLSCPLLLGCRVRHREDQNHRGKTNRRPGRWVTRWTFRTQRDHRRQTLLWCCCNLLVCRVWSALKESSSEVVQPFLMGCGTKEPKITQLCLAAIQRLMSHEVVSEVRLACTRLFQQTWRHILFCEESWRKRFMCVCVHVQAAAGNIINMLWQLMENGLEELKLLQTVLVLLTTNTVVHDEVLSKVPYTLIKQTLQ